MKGLMGRLLRGIKRAGRQSKVPHVFFCPVCGASQFMDYGRNNVAVSHLEVTTGIDERAIAKGTAQKNVSIENHASIAKSFVFYQDQGTSMTIGKRTGTISGD